VSTLSPERGPRYDPAGVGEGVGGGYGAAGGPAPEGRGPPWPRPSGARQPAAPGPYSARSGPATCGVVRLSDADARIHRSIGSISRDDWVARSRTRRRNRAARIRRSRRSTAGADRRRRNRQRPVASSGPRTSPESPARSRSRRASLVGPDPPGDVARHWRRQLTRFSTSIVRRVGFEPTRPCGQSGLSRSRLPCYATAARDGAYPEPVPLLRRRVRRRRRGRRLVLLAGLGAAAAAFRQRKLAENERQTWSDPQQ
jgi:hypothetical protein